MRILSLLVALAFGLTTEAQLHVGQWKTMFGERTVSHIEPIKNGLAFSTTHAVGLADNNSGTINWLNTTNGLSGAQLSCMAYDHSTQQLVMVQSDGHIDIWHNGEIATMYDVFRARGNTATYHQLLCENGIAYLACSFGIVKLNLSKLEVSETWYIGTEGSEEAVQQLALLPESGLFYAATNSGLKYCTLTESNPMDYRSWLSAHTRPVTQLQVYNSDLWLVFADAPSDIVRQSDGQVFSIAGNISGLRASEGGFWLWTSSSSYRFDGTIWQNQTLSNVRDLWQSSETTWVADNYYGLLRNNEMLSNQLIGEDNASALALSSPEALWLGSLSDGSYILAKQGAEGEFEQLWSGSFSDAPTHYLADSEGNIWLIDARKKLWKLAAQTQNWQPQTEVLAAETIALSPSGELWTAASSAGIWRFSRGVWQQYNPAALQNSFTLSSLVLTPNNQLWLVQNGALLVIEPENGNSLRFLPYTSEAQLISSLVNHIALDLDGNLWGACDNGAFVLPAPQSVLQNGNVPACYRPITEGDGEAAYLLSKKNVLQVLVDAANRKWMATDKSGLFLTNPEGNKILANYTPNNSPLPTYGIHSLYLQPALGELYVQTEAGTYVHRSSAAESKTDILGAYVFPNPVRPEYEGPITLTGLSNNSFVKLTDVAGNLVLQGRSLGGQFIWDGKLTNGQRAASGVYLFFCTTANGSQSTVVKLLLIH